MVTIKITHQNTFRRFVLSNDATWSDLETKLRSLFPIPASTPFTLSYVDEDNDVITLSTDLELREVLSPQLHTSTIKFNLKFPTTTDATSDGEDSNSEAWIFEGVKTPPQPTASVVGTVGTDGPDNVSQKNITSTTNQEAQQIESDSEEVSSNKKSLLDDDLYEEGSSSIKKNTMDEFYKSFDSLGFVPIITPINEDKGKQKEAIGESSSPTLTTPITSTSPASSSLILLLEDQPDNQPPQVNQNNQPPQVNQNNQPPQVNQNSQPPIQPPQVNQNNQPPQEPELSVYELADNFQKMFDKFKKNNPELMGQLYQLISANFSPQDRPQENQSQNNQQHQQESRDQRQQYYSLSSQPSQSRRNNDDFFDNPPTLFSRPQIPGSFPAPPRTTQSVQQCPWAGQARSDSDLFESNNNTRGSVRQNKYRRNRRRRHNHHNREYEDRHEHREETQETQEEEREETEETLEAREAAREQKAARERELQRETQEVQRETSPYQEQIESLTSMGLCSNENEDQCTELLTIYEGNVQQVIEYLLEGQQP